MKNCTKSLYDFATIDGEYFCYLDDKRFSQKVELLNHIGNAHMEDQDQCELAQWGIDWRIATSQAEFLNRKLSLRLDR